MTIGMTQDVQSVFAGPDRNVWTRWMGGLIAAALLGLILTGCTPGLPRRGKQGGITYEAKVDQRFHGFRRTYRVHLPRGYDPGRALPLLVVLHGAFDTAKGMEQVTRFSDLADQENFIVLYPNGIGIFGFLQHWNAGHCCGKAAADEIDDVGFLAGVIEDACTRLPVDRHRIYMTGFSNGGMMVHRFAAERGELLAAAAPLAATAGGRPDAQSPEWSIPYPQAPLPLLAMHGLADAYVPFTGGISPARGGEREYWSVQSSLDIWIARNGCAETPMVRNTHQGKVRITLWPEPEHGWDVVLYTLEGWGHQWPGPELTGKLDPLDPLYDFDAARVLWDFFKTHTR